MGTLHARCMRRVHYWMSDTFRPQLETRARLPFELVNDSIPEPDGVVLTAEQYARHPYPDAALVVTEVADGSVEVDREIADDYAAAGVPDYWIVNVRDRHIEVYRTPVPDPASPTGHRYADRRVYAVAESVAPLARADVLVAVGTLVDAG